MTLTWPSIGSRVPTLLADARFSLKRSTDSTDAAGRPREAEATRQPNRAAATVTIERPQLRAAANSADGLDPLRAALGSVDLGPRRAKHHVLRLSGTEVPSLPRRYPASLVLRTSPPPRAPGPSLAGVRLVIPDHVAGLPVLRALSFMYVLPPLPRCSDWASSSLFSPSRVGLPRKRRRIGLHIVLFEIP